MAKKTFRGVEVNQEIDPNQQLRDIRTMGEKFADFFKVPANVVMTLGVLSGACWWYQDFAPFMFFIAACITKFALTKKESTPLKMPKQAKCLDPNEKNPGTGKPMMADGIFYLGNEYRNGKEIWLTNSDCRQHFLVLGTTGAGKALPDTELVMTSSGWKKMGAIRVGDMVLTPKGEFVPVSGYYPQGLRDINRVTLETGQNLECCPEHLWKVFIRNGGMISAIVKTDELIERMKHTTQYIRMTAVYADSITDSNNIEDFIDSNNMIYGTVLQRRRFIRRMLSLQNKFSEREAELLTRIIWSTGRYAKQDGCKIITRYNGDNDIESNKCDYVEISDITFIGKDYASCIMIADKDHMFVARDFIQTHNTEALLGFAANALSWSSGFLFCDGKGDVSLFAKVNAMCRRFGREDDILVLNFMTGNSDVDGGAEVMSNSLNPFATGSSDGLTQMVVSLMDDAGGDGAMWKGRATAMLTGVMRALCWMRRAGLVELNVGTIRDFMGLPKIIELANKDKYPEMPEAIRTTIKSYLQSLPGFQPEKGAKQAQTTLDQHGYLEMQFTKILGSLADVYGHIFKTPYGEVDMYDVVLNRRVLVIMLPALEKSADELGNLGKIVCASLKGMMGGTLGSKIEGTWKDVVDNRPTNSPSPFLVILDEVGYYTVEGLALMAAQARSLGFSMIYASQDIPAMKKKNEKEAASIIANTNTKIFMRLEEPNETAKLAIDRGAKAMRARTSGYERQTGGVDGHQYMDATGTQFEDQDRIHLTDLTAQSEGEMHILHKDRIVRGKTWYADAPGSLDTGKLQLGANHFIAVPLPNHDQLLEEDKLPELLERLTDKGGKSLIADMKKQISISIANMNQDKDAPVTRLAYAFKKMISKQRSPVEAGGGAIAFCADPANKAGETFVAQVSSINKSTVSNKNNMATSGGRVDMSDSDSEMEKMSGRPATRKSRINTNVMHGVVTEGDDGQDKRHDISKHLISSEAIIQSLASLDFDEDEEDSKTEVEGALDDILGRTDEYDDVEKHRLMNIVEDIERSQHEIEENSKTTFTGEKTDAPVVSTESEEEEDATDASFLDELLGGDDD